MKNKIGVVTVTYNSADVLDGFLESMKNQTHKNYILYIVDNASHDKTAKIISEFGDSHITYIQNNLNIGVAAGNNQGIKRAINEECEYVLLLNNDTEFEPELFEKLLNDLENNKVDIVVPKMYYSDNKNIIWYAGGNFDNIFQCDVNHIGFRQEDIGQYNICSTITYAPTCCMLLKKEIFEDVGLMDEKYFVYEDDVDFCFRATIINKKKMLYLPHYKFYHKVGGLANKERLSYLSNFEIQMIGRNKIYRCKKFLTVSRFFYIIVMILRENIKLCLKKNYKRSLESFFLLNKSFIKGLFY